MSTARASARPTVAVDWVPTFEWSAMLFAPYLEKQADDKGRRSVGLRKEDGGLARLHLLVLLFPPSR